MLTPTFDLLCAICFSLYTSTAVQRGARCGAVSEKRPDACPGKLIETDPRTEPRAPRQSKRRKAAIAAEAVAK
jgi:hypothetical protein